MKNKKKVIKNIIIVIAPLIGGFLSSLLANLKNYNIINKPMFSPPKIVFPIVWSILYLLFGISFYLANKAYSLPEEAELGQKVMQVNNSVKQ